MVYSEEGYTIEMLHHADVPGKAVRHADALNACAASLLEGYADICITESDKVAADFVHSTHTPSQHWFGDAAMLEHLPCALQQDHH